MTWNLLNPSDEFYTKLEDIESELSFYDRSIFKDTIIKGIEGEESSFNSLFLVWVANRPLYQGTGSIFQKAENLHP